MLNLKQALKRENLKQGYRYTLISIFSYEYVFVSLYLLVDVFNWNKQLSFLVVYGIAYLLLYTIQLNFLFFKSHDKRKFLKYCFVILSFYLIANLLYFIGLKFGVHYLITTVLTIFVLMPLRFIVYKYFVYKD